MADLRSRRDAPIHEHKIVTDPTAGVAARASRAKSDAEADPWSNWVSEKRAIDSPSRGLATSPAVFESHDAAMPGTPDSMLFWGAEEEQDMAEESDSEPESDAGAVGSEPGRMNSANQPTITAAPPPTGNNPTHGGPSRGGTMIATAISEEEAPPKGRIKKGGKKSVQILILEDGKGGGEPELKPEQLELKPIEGGSADKAVEPASPTFIVPPAPANKLTKKEQKAADELAAKQLQLTNLAKRFPGVPLEKVQATLAEAKGHAGRASKILMRQVMEERAMVDELVQAEKQAMSALDGQRSTDVKAPPEVSNTSHGKSAAAADADLPAAIELTGSFAQPGMNGIYVKVGTVNDRAAYLSTEESGLVLYWQYNIDVRCADGMQNQWLIADSVGKGYRACAFGLPGGGPLDVPPRSWQVVSTHTTPTTT